MKVIAKGKKNPLLTQVTCKHCKSVLEITPKDCVNYSCVAFGDTFCVTCPECNLSSAYDRKRVLYEFWRRIPTPGER